MNLLLIQTAFLGDVVLITPLAQAAHERLDARVTVVARPSATDLLRGHPAVDEVVAYDKYGAARGVRGLITLARRFRASRFDAALIPHRSVRSALLVRWAGIPVRAGFETSAGRFLFTHRIPYRAVHEVERNMDLLGPWIKPPSGYVPSLYPDDADRAEADTLLAQHAVTPSDMLAGIAPGSVWETKRWLPDRFAQTARRMARETGVRVVLFGGPEETALCQSIARQAGDVVIVAAGRLAPLQSAALVARCTVLVSNDTGMAHIAAAMRTPVIGLFGPTVPAFGFGPYGDGHRIVEQPLPCRPCSRHGGRACPIGTHACMTEITVDRVMSEVETIVGTTHASPPMTPDA